MPQQNQTLIEVGDDATADGSAGHRNSASLKTAYPGSPCYTTGDVYAGSDEAVKTAFIAEVQTGFVLNGLGTPSYSRDFTENTNWVLGEGNGVPDIPTDVSVAAAVGDGLPANAYMPNVNSAGVVPTSDQTNSYAIWAESINYGSGPTVPSSPATTSGLVELQEIASDSGGGLSMGSSGA